MAESPSLEMRIRTMEDVEQIRKLKAKYWRCVDRKLWDELADCFTEDATADYGPDSVLESRKAIMQFFRDALGTSTMITAHGGHNAEIEIVDVNTARATWALNDIVIIQPNTRMEGWGYYEDVYSKQNGQWRIKSTKIGRYLEEWGMQKR